MSAHAASPEELVLRKKKYINVFWGLIVLTVVELLIVFAGQKFPSISKLLINAGIVVFSAGKAVVVGYYYMHLEHETKWLKFVACLPVIAFLYAFFLVLDVKNDRHMSVYQGQPNRSFPAFMLDRAKHALHGQPQSGQGAHGTATQDTGHQTEAGKEYHEKSGVNSEAASSSSESH